MLAQVPSSYIDCRMALIWAARRRALGNSDAVGFLGERVLDQLELAARLVDQAEQDDVVGGHRVDPALAHRVGTLRVGVERGHLGVGSQLVRLSSDVDPSTEQVVRSPVFRSSIPATPFGFLPGP